MMKATIASSTRQRICHRMIDCLNAFQGKDVSENVNSDRYIITGKLVLHHSIEEPAPPGLSLSVQLFSCSEISPRESFPASSEYFSLKHGKSSKNKLTETRAVTYELEFIADAGFGVPGAFVIRNQHKFKFLLGSMTLEIPHDQTVHFECNSWVYPIHLTQKDRIFFSNSVSVSHLYSALCSFDAIKGIFYIYIYNICYR